MEKRTFISADLPAAIKDYLKTLQNLGIYWIRWMKPENLHITLNFLGYLNEQEIEEVKTIMAETAVRFESFTLHLPQVRQERDMLWLIPAESETLTRLQDDLKTQLRSRRLGQKERRPYRPHILFAKSKTGRRMTWEPKNFRPLEFTVEKINLYESKLTPKAATHILIQSFPLV